MRSPLQFLYDRFQQYSTNQALICNDTTVNYNELLERERHWANFLQQHDIKPGTVVSLEGDFTPNTITMLFALISNCCIVVPLSNSSSRSLSIFHEIGQVEVKLKVEADDSIQIEHTAFKATHDFYERLRERGHPGLVLFSSGTSGTPKGAVHDFSALLEKFKSSRTALKTLNFLLFDHWGGLNTLFHVLSCGGTVITLRTRSPHYVCQAIERHKAELLPTSPTFLNMLIMSEAYLEFDLSSLKIVSYGTEPMPQSTLKRMRELFPQVRLQQTYGLIEVGVLRSKSKADDSLWVKLGGEGYQTRVVDGILQIKAQSSMFGYLNAQSPFTEDGWFITGDSVEVDGEYFRILGRKSELINVGGEKVYPAEVESVIQEMDNVLEVTVFGEKNPLIGNIVCARLTLRKDEPKTEVFNKLRKFCATRLENFKIPAKIEIVSQNQFGDRFKKLRANNPH